MIWRFGQHSIQRLGAFNGDPHPGNYRFHHDGSVTFLDFGLVKRWDARRVGAARAEPRRDRRAPRPRAARGGDGGRPGSSPPATASIPTRSTTTCPARTGRTSSTSSRSPATGCATRSARIFDINGPHAEVIAKLNMPPSFVILDRVVWGVSAILGKLDVSQPVAGDAARVPHRRAAGDRARRRRGGLARRAPGDAVVSSAVTTMTDRSRRAVNGIELDVIEAGEPGNPAVVLCHGFPESAHSWRHQIEPLAAAGYHVLAPDQRGYGRSSAPRDVAAYGIEHLAATCSACSTPPATTTPCSSATTGARCSCGTSPACTRRGCAPWSTSACPTRSGRRRRPTCSRSPSGDRFFYILYFQQVGPAERELEADVERTMRTILWAASGDGFRRRPAGAAAGGRAPASSTRWRAADRCRTSCRPG